MKKYAKPFLFLPALLVMILIYQFSAQTADRSSWTSGSLIADFLFFFDPRFSTQTPAMQALRIEGWQFIVRKGAHFSIYAALGFFFALGWHAYRKPRSASLLSWGCTALYAVSDEIHQYFVPGRSCEVRDMTIDAAGALLGVLVFLAVRLIAAAIRKKRKKTDLSEKNT